MTYTFDRDPTRKSLEGYHSNTERSRYPDRGHVGHSTLVGPTIQYDWAVEPEVPDEFEDDKRISKNKIIHLVRRLKCGKVTSKERKQRQLGFEMNQAQRHDGRNEEGWGYHQPSKPRTMRYSRNVNITVERGDAARPSTEYPRRQSSLSDFGEPRFRPVRGRIPDGRLDNNYFSPIMLMDQQSSPKVGSERISVQKERWLKLIQQGWSENHDQPTAISPGAGDYSPARGSISTSRRCDSATSNSGDTEYTTESEETDPCNPRRSSAPQRVHKVPQNQTSRRKGSTNQRRPTNNKDSKNDLWEGLAEDFGIFAGLLLSDGSACVGTISDITRETVADSCNSTGNDPPTDLGTLYSIDVRDHSLLGSD